MKIYLLRHGQTDWNLENRLQGRCDVPMNRTGRMQIEALAKKLHMMDFHIDSIISSPLGRARESAEIVAGEIGFSRNIILDEGFLERSFGLAEGVIWNKDMDVEDEKYEAEKVSEIYQRAQNAIEKYLIDMDKNILIVAHGAILSAVKSVLSQGILGYYDGSVPIIQGNVLCCEIRDNGKREFYNLF